MTGYWCESVGCNRMVAVDHIVHVEDLAFGIDADGLALSHRIFCRPCADDHARSLGEPLEVY